MKDFHCHILPGLDDGAQDLAETEKMLKRAAESKIDTIAATCHYSSEGDAKYDETWEKVKELADAHSIRLLKGTEYDLEYIADIPKDKLRTIGDTKFLLVDMNRNYIVHGMTNLFFELKLAGFQIIFAHPERMLPLKDLKRLIKLLEENAIYIQVDSGSVTGRYGHEAKVNARYLLDHGGCHFLWNDAHKRRHFLFDVCRHIFVKHYSLASFYLLTEENPAALLAGKEIRPMPKRRTFWDRLFRRQS